MFETAVDLIKSQKNDTLQGRKRRLLLSCEYSNHRHCHHIRQVALGIYHTDYGSFSAHNFSLQRGNR
ncbi:hypothetical protein L6452_42149 [Arctium lappa]|uniref:Uncharacterized protein n=1 Tax=Arctium lappa TaxID=4217 RepID=A0ACB8XHG3_ARCLA|nr:hypothetical protein L6452_42149 [Arctium lappa]